MRLQPATEVALSVTERVHSELRRARGTTAAPRERVLERYRAMVGEASVFAEQMRDAHAGFDYASHITGADQPRRRMQWLKRNPAFSRTDYGMWIIQDKKDYSGRDLKRDGVHEFTYTAYSELTHGGVNHTRRTPWYVHECIAVAALDGALLYLRKRGRDDEYSAFIPAESRIYSFDPEASLATPEQLFDVEKVTERDLGKIGERWQNDLVRAAGKYAIKPAQLVLGEYSVLPILRD